MIDVSDGERNIIVETLRKCAVDGEVWAFGSRYDGSASRNGATHYSDLDLAIVTTDKKPLSMMEMAKIREVFDESELPYRVDILDYWGIQSEFRAVIDSGHEVIFRGTP